MKKQTKYLVGYLVTFVAMVVMNYWVGTDVGDIADTYQSLIQPAGYAFSIWGIIYILIFSWMIRLSIKEDPRKEDVEKISYWPIINFLLNGSWIILFTQELLGLSSIVIALLLGTLFIIHKNLYTHKSHWLVKLSFSMYYGWVTVATIVNIFAWFIQSDINEVFGMPELTWATIMVIVGTLLAMMVSYLYADWIYPLVFIWSYVAILIENQFTHVGYAIVLIVCMVVQLGFSMWILFGNRRKKLYS